MLKEENPWGEVITLGYDDEADEEDEIRSLIKQVEELKKRSVEWEGMTLDEAKKKRRGEINKLEKKIYDLIHLKKQKNLFKK